MRARVYFRKSSGSWCVRATDGDRETMRVIGKGEESRRRAVDLVERISGAEFSGLDEIPRKHDGLSAYVCWRKAQSQWAVRMHHAGKDHLRLTGHG